LHLSSGKLSIYEPLRRFVAGARKPFIYPPWSGFLVLSALWIPENRESTGQFENQSEKIKKNFQKETFGFLARQLCPSKGVP
jgi:hypothetical protein